jgi:putative redox protein
MSTLLFDFAGCGESQGNFADISLGGHLEDLTSAVDFCAQKGYTNIITMGRSFGGTTAICQAPSDDRVKGVCSLAAPSSLLELFLGFTDEELPEDENALVSLAGNESIIYLRKAFFTDLARHDTARCASLLSPRPLLVVQGSLDAVVPPGDAGILYDRAGEPKELRILEGADHQFSSHYREVWELFVGWVKHNF